jgi:hypothetical protein
MVARRHKDADSKGIWDCGLEDVGPSSSAPLAKREGSL